MTQPHHPTRTCTADDCDRPHWARGYCKRHYSREIVRADATRRRPPTTIHLEDVEWLAETGETLEGAVRRLGVEENTLIRRLERAGRYDLVSVLRRRNVA